jgi:hypothetical protein
VTSKRFSVIVAPVGLDGLPLKGASSLEPATLTLDTASGRSETLSFEIRSDRGRGFSIMRGETWSERRVVGSIMMGQTMEALSVCPPGHDVVQLVLDGPETNNKRTCHVFTVVSDEILTGARELRRSKPKTPTPKMANDEVWKCSSCGMKTMSRGSDNPGWKGVQMSPKKPEYTYFCGKPACAQARDAAIEVAKVNWGYESTSGADPERQSAPAQEQTAGKYGPPADKPFL